MALERRAVREFVRRVQRAPFRVAEFARRVRRARRRGVECERLDRRLLVEENQCARGHWSRRHSEISRDYDSRSILQKSGRRRKTCPVSPIVYYLYINKLKS